MTYTESIKSNNKRFEFQQKTGGIIILLSSDFKQTLPIVPRSTYVMI